jgi:hypothetical protein
MNKSDANPLREVIKVQARRRGARLGRGWYSVTHLNPKNSRVRNAKCVAAIILTIVSIAFCGSSWAQVELPFAPTPAELARLPPECAVKLGNGPDNQAKNAAYAARYGEAIWLHYHHYCFALNFMNRQSLVLGNKPARRYDLQSAINNFNYLIVHWPANSPQRLQAIRFKQLAEMQLKSIR